MKSVKHLVSEIESQLIDKDDVYKSLLKIVVSLMAKREANDIFDQVLKNGGIFVTKIWKGSEEKNLIEKLKSKFEYVSYFKPNSSRKDSSEIFLISVNYHK